MIQDEDGTALCSDRDTDNDGIPNSIERTLPNPDMDNDGLINIFDTDTDNDSISDTDEYAPCYNTTEASNTFNSGSSVEVIDFSTANSFNNSYYVQLRSKTSCYNVSSMLKAEINVLQNSITVIEYNHFNSDQKDSMDGNGTNTITSRSGTYAKIKYVLQGDKLFLHHVVNSCGSRTLQSTASCWNPLATCDKTGALPDYAYALDATINTVNGTLSANLSGATYQWIDCDANNQPINGAINQSYTPSKSGNYAVIISDQEIANCANTSKCIRFDSGDTTTSTTGQSAFKNHSIPGTIQIEDYDNGGQGVAYNDSNTVNSGGQGRINEGVDVGITTAPGGGEIVGWTIDGEWLEYTLGTVKAGTYDITFRGASNVAAVKSVTASLGSINLGTIPFNNSGGWHTFQDYVLADVTITNGKTNQVLRLAINEGLLNLDWVRFDEKFVALPSDTYIVRAKGITGQENIRLLIDEEEVERFSLNTSFANYTATVSSGRGAVKIEYFNDEGEFDVEVDYLEINDITYQAEDQTINTAFWANGSCGGGSNSQLMHCNGYIEYGNTQGKLQEIETYSIYPNPTSSNVVLTGIKKNDIVQIFDMHGRMVYKSIVEDVSLSNSSLDVSNYIKGVYFIKINTSTVLKLVKD